MAYTQIYNDSERSSSSWMEKRVHRGLITSLGKLSKCVDIVSSSTTFFTWVAGLGGSYDYSGSSTSNTSKLGGLEDKGSEHMFVNCHVPHVPEDEELQLGHIYFIMPISKLHKILTLQELCLLAIKASVALDKKCSSQMKKGGGGSRSFNGRRKGKNGGARKHQKVDFQLALKQLG
ncbi:hypothetical protein CTI12_AA237180 [Artemisia annua]|uniref:Uncharacterized protein n=1 Tax=Artemisia annua TaxID=35608 RepID=A0A2U1M6V0_ARTAN|nr:hypothetical protein CTI12_AA237180 [Artemisia annua]